MQRDLLPFGTYQGRVVATEDPEARRRVRVVCPQVLGAAATNWAEPSVSGGAVPSIGQDVWIVFHGGDLARPIYLTSVDVADLVRRVTAIEAQLQA